MNIIDHRILIPATPESIWNVVGNIQRLPEWQVNCKNITILTSPQSTPGPGMRWRYSTHRGADIVIMATAWYDRLGYEYTFVDGSPLKETKGQIRLQETAEGTVVQWTFQYESTGMLSGLRGTRRSIENDIVESLRDLYRLLVSDRNAQYKDSRSSVREAPDVNQRAKYKATSKLETDEHKAVDNVEDDTRPRGVEIEQTVTASYEANELPSDSMFAPPPDYTPEISADKPETEVTESVSENLQASIESEPVPPPDIFSDEPVSSSEGNIRDTSQLSVFELFGLPKPSDTREVKRVTVDQVVAEHEATPPELQPTEPIKITPDEFAIRIGLRGQLRRKQVNTRR